MDTLRRAAPGGDVLHHIVRDWAAWTIMPAEDGSVPQARAYTSEALTRWGVSAEDAALVVTELASNAVKAAREMRSSEVRIWVTRGRGQVLVQVGDRSGLPPVIPPPSQASEGGRGLQLVAALALRAGWYRHDGWKIVWAALPASPASEAGRTEAPAAGRGALGRAA